MILLPIAMLGSLAVFEIHKAHHDIWILPTIGWLFTIPFGWTFFAMAWKAATRYRQPMPSSSISHDERWAPVAQGLKDAGLETANIRGYCVFGNGWELRTFTIPQMPGWTLGVLMLAQNLSRIIPEELIYPWNALVLSFYIFFWGCGIRDLLRPRVAIAASPAALQLLKSQSGPAQVVLAHEVSHLKHRDTGRRSLWFGATFGFAGVSPAIAIAVLAILFDGLRVISAILIISVLIAASIAWWSLRYVAVAQELRADLEATQTPEDFKNIIAVLKGGNTKKLTVALRIKALETASIPIPRLSFGLRICFAALSLVLGAVGIAMLN